MSQCVKIILFFFRKKKKKKKKAPNPNIISHFLGIFLIFSHTATNLVEDKQALLDVLNNISHPHSFNWNQSSLCKNWTRVLCNNDHSRVIELRLPEVGLRSPIPPDTLSRLSAIKIERYIWSFPFWQNGQKAPNTL
jgi:hypothetical protein